MLGRLAINLRIRNEVDDRRHHKSATATCFEHVAATRPDDAHRRKKEERLPYLELREQDPMSHSCLLFTNQETVRYRVLGVMLKFGRRLNNGGRRNGCTDE